MGTYDLAQLDAAHPNIWVEPFVRAFAVRNSGAAGSSHSTVIYARPSSVVGRPKKQSWTILTPPTLSATDVAKARNGIANNTVTEYAACCVAAVLVSSVLGQQCHEVTVSGQRADYWLRDVAGAPAGACEVSGLITKKLKTRYRSKRNQILKNKTASPAYVCVVAFNALDEGYFCRVR